MAVKTQYQAVGRRKTSVARVYIRPGSGAAEVNKKPADEYFPLPWRRQKIFDPFQVTETEGQFDLVINVDGGGVTGQVEAIRHGVARALLEYDEELRKPLRDAGYLTRDPRMKERKKYGQPKARKKSQFSKR